MVVESPTLTCIPDLSPSRSAVGISLEVNTRNLILFTSLIVYKVLCEDTLLKCSVVSSLNRDKILTEEADELLYESRIVHCSKREVLSCCISLLYNSGFNSLIPSLFELLGNLLKVALNVHIVSRIVFVCIKNRIEELLLVVSHQRLVLDHSSEVLTNVDVIMFLDELSCVFESLIEFIGVETFVLFLRELVEYLGSFLIP